MDLREKGRLSDLLVSQQHDFDRLRIHHNMLGHLS